jgi:glycosyltransferase involved in cell wall biosynthesis
MHPTVSILTTVYNREKYIAECIESVLVSTYHDWEMIIVDDCSTDNSLAIAREYKKKDARIKVFVNPTNLGDYPNRNRAASLATGKYLKYLDSDDLIYPYSIEAFVFGMEKYPKAALGLCNTTINDHRPYPFELTPNQAYEEHYFKHGFLNIGPTGVIIRRDCFEAMGGFNEQRHIGDTELWLRLAAKYNVVKLQPGLDWWRMHEGQEIAIEIKNPDVLTIRHLAHLNLLSSGIVPLSPSQINSIARKVKQHHARQLLRILLIAHKPAAFLHLFLNSRLSFFELLKGFLPYYK